MKNNQKLESLRAKIDLIDSKIKKLLSERFGIASEIAKYKKANNLQTFDSGREKEILGKMDTTHQKAVFKQILKESKKVQDPGNK